jgi:hypothetical protein
LQRPSCLPIKSLRLVAAHAVGAPSSTETHSEDGAMAKGQKKSNKEVRKPKADKPKVVAAGPSPFLTPPSNKKK